MERSGGEQGDDEERQHLSVSDPGPSIHNNNNNNFYPVVWPTIDGPLGLSSDESLAYARRFFKWGFFLLPLLWAVNCFYFWPVLIRKNTTNNSPSSTSFRLIRPYIVGSAIGFLVFSVILTSWALTFMIGGERLFGPVWGNLVMYNVAEKLGLPGWT